MTVTPPPDGGSDFEEGCLPDGSSDSVEGYLPDGSSSAGGRPLVEADIKELLAIEAVSNPLPWSEGMFRQELTNELSRFFVFEMNNSVIGFGGYWDMAGHGHISNIAVRPDCRRRGYGRLMIEFLLEDMMAQGIEAATLEVRSSNSAAAALYASCGFTLEGRRKRYYRNGEDALIYSKTL